MKLMQLFEFRRRIPDSRNVLQLNKSIDKAGSVMDVFAETAEVAGFDLGPDADSIELALLDFFTDRDAREQASTVLKSGA